MDWPLMTGSVPEMMSAYERQWQREWEALNAPDGQECWAWPYRPDNMDREDL